MRLGGLSRSSGCGRGHGGFSGNSLVRPMEFSVSRALLEGRGNWPREGNRNERQRGTAGSWKRARRRRGTTGSRSAGLRPAGRPAAGWLAAGWAAVRGAAAVSGAGVVRRVSAVPGVSGVRRTAAAAAAEAGTEIVLTADGEVLTNHHVIEGATSISVTDIGNGKTYTASVVGYDEQHDIAVLKLKDASGLQTA